MGLSTASSAAANRAVSSSLVVWPYWQLITYSRPVSMAAATAAFLASSCSMVSSAWMPAWIFSQTLGTPKKAVGLTWPTTLIASVGTWQKYVWPAPQMARYSVNIRSAIWASGRYETQRTWFMVLPDISAVLHSYTTLACVMMTPLGLAVVPE